MYDLQQNEWTPLIDWFCKRYDVNLSATRDISPPVIDTNIKAVIQRHLLSYNFAAINGNGLRTIFLSIILLIFIYLVEIYKLVVC